MHRKAPTLRRSHLAETGFTLLELILACAILMVLSGSAVPIARFTVRRQKEAELHRDLREMRDAIDRYKDAADRNLIRVEAGTEGYPPDLDTLVSGVDLAGPLQSAPGSTTAGPGATGGFGGAPTSGFGASSGSGFGATAGTATPFGSSSQSSLGVDAIRHVRFLRRIPVDPMTGHAEWGMRSVQDDPDSGSWGGKDVFDVYSLSTGTALDNTKYSDW
jgi:general secretion pathway protein G